MNRTTRPVERMSEAATDNIYDTRLLLQRMRRLMES
jgi:hypothetical protein